MRSWLVHSILLLESSILYHALVFCFTLRWLLPFLWSRLTGGLTLHSSDTFSLSYSLPAEFLTHDCGILSATTARLPQCLQQDRWHLLPTQKHHLAFLRTPAKCTAVGRGQISDGLILQMSNKTDVKGRLLGHRPGKLCVAEASPQPKDGESVLQPKVKGQGPVSNMHSKIKTIQWTGVWLYLIPRVTLTQESKPQLTVRDKLWRAR